MKITAKLTEKLAKALYAFEDPDSSLPYLEPDTQKFDSELKAYEENYPSLMKERKTNLEQSISWLLTNKINSPKDITSIIPDLYRRIWNHHQDTEETEKIINEELDTKRYAKAIEYIFKQALAS